MSGCTGNIQVYVVGIVELMWGEDGYHYRGQSDRLGNFNNSHPSCSLHHNFKHSGIKWLSRTVVCLHSYILSYSEEWSHWGSHALCKVSAKRCYYLGNGPRTPVRGGDSEGVSVWDSLNAHLLILPEPFALWAREWQSDNNTRLHIQVKTYTISSNNLDILLEPLSFSVIIIYPQPEKPQTTPGTIYKIFSSSGKWIEFDNTLYTLIFPCHFNNPNH